MKPRIMYMGTPEFAVPALERLAFSDACEVVLVVTQPDRPAGRGKRVVSPSVKVAADRLGLPVLQTGTLRDPAVRERIIRVQPDLIVVAAFGMILGRWILDLPARGCVNLHASLLPKYRGANPIASAIAMGEERTGVSLMRMEQGLDTGPVYATSDIHVGRETTESLTMKLAQLAGDTLANHLDALLAGTIDAQPQEEGATLTRLMTKNDGWLDFSRTALELERHVRAMWSWPRAWTTTADGSRIQLHETAVDQETRLSAGTVRNDGRVVLVGTGDGALVLRRIQLPGGKPIESHSIAQVPALADGAVLGGMGAPERVTPLVVPVE
jgi:methionyl-tRNA formyltransferase